MYAFGRSYLVEFNTLHRMPFTGSFVAERDEFAFKKTAKYAIGYIDVLRIYENFQIDLEEDN